VTEPIYIPKFVRFLPGRLRHRREHNLKLNERALDCARAPEWSGRVGREEVADGRNRTCRLMVMYPDIVAGQVGCRRSVAVTCLGISAIEDEQLMIPQNFSTQMLHAKRDTQLNWQLQLDGRAPFWPTPDQRLPAPGDSPRSWGEAHAAKFERNETARCTITDFPPRLAAHSLRHFDIHSVSMADIAGRPAYANAARLPGLIAGIAARSGGTASAA